MTFIRAPYVADVSDGVEVLAVVQDRIVAVRYGKQMALAFHPEKTPRRLYEEVYITIHPGTLSRDGTWATRLISTCDHCGLCKEVCPQHISIREELEKVSETFCK